MKPLSMGCDPEVILQCIHTGVPVSAIGRLPGTKERPHRVVDGAVQVDNVLAEFNTMPKTTSTEFNGVVHSVYQQMMNIICDTDHNVGPTCRSVDEYGETELAHKAARIVGCDPDWNAYTLRLNDPPDYIHHSLRSAGGHVHFGLDITPPEIPHFIKVCDLLITLPMLAVEDSRRRQFYGVAGSFRIKPYGVEYRTPSNHWVFHDSTRLWMAEQMKLVAGIHKDVRDIPDGLDSIINEHNLIKAEEIVSALSLERYPFDASIH